LKYLHVIIGIQTESALSSPSLDGRGLGGRVKIMPAKSAVSPLSPTLSHQGRGREPKFPDGN
jgi:hypothetical protein